MTFIRNAIHRFLSGLGRFLFLMVLLSITGTITAWYSIKTVVSGRIVTIPDFHGFPRDQAVSQAEDLGLIVEFDDQTVHTRVVEKGHVVFQNPKPGKRIKSGRMVELTLSGGPEKKTVPDLGGEPLGFAELLVDRADTEIAKVTRVPNPSVPKGRIMTQIPRSGEEIGVLPGVSVLLSDGPEKTWYVTPDFVGRRYAVVKTFLDAHRFRVVTKFKSFEEGLGDRVLRQIPQAGYPIHQDQTITLEVNRD